MSNLLEFKRKSNNTYENQIKEYSVKELLDESNKLILLCKQDNLFNQNTYDKISAIKFEMASRIQKESETLQSMVDSLKSDIKKSRLSLV